MPKRRDPKLETLRHEGALHPRPDAVQDELFKVRPRNRCGLGGLKG